MEIVILFLKKRFSLLGLFKKVRFTDTALHFVLCETETVFYSNGKIATFEKPESFFKKYHTKGAVRIRIDGNHLIKHALENVGPNKKKSTELVIGFLKSGNLALELSRNDSPEKLYHCLAHQVQDTLNRVKKGVGPLKKVKK
jgi:hypothetical protein